MVKPRRLETKKSHIIIFGSLFCIVLFLITYSLAMSVSLYPSNNNPIHTTLMYYDHQFSDKILTEDLKTALYVINQSDEAIYAAIFEYDRSHKETSTIIQISPRKEQYIKTNGPGVVYLNNTDNTATSIVKFSRWYTYKKYTIPDGFIF